MRIRRRLPLAISQVLDVAGAGLQLSCRDYHQAQVFDLVYGPECYTDPQTGIQMIDGRYLISCNQSISAQLGDYLSLTLTDGSVVRCVKADETRENEWFYLADMPVFNRKKTAITGGITQISMEQPSFLYLYQSDSGFSFQPTLSESFGICLGRSPSIVSARHLLLQLGITEEEAERIIDRDFYLNVENAPEISWQNKPRELEKSRIFFEEYGGMELC